MFFNNKFNDGLEDKLHEIVWMRMSDTLPPHK